VTAVPNVLAQVAILFAVPTSRADLLDMAQGEVLPDYRAMFDSEDEAALLSAAQPIIAAAEQLLDVAENLGIQVRRRAGLADLGAVTASARVVILFAHWRGALVTLQDLPTDWRAVATRLQSLAPPFGELRACTTPTDLVNAMNRVLSNGAAASHASAALGTTVQANRAVSLALGRDALDAAFAGLLRRGNCVELFDGLHTPGNVEVAIAPSFRGELDLTMCDSVALATLLDIRRAGTIRHIHWPELVAPVPQYLLVAEALKRYAAAAGSRSYIDIRLSLQKALLEV
jgi:hypothetical protein